MCVGCLGFVVVKFFFSLLIKEPKDREGGKATVKIIGKEYKFFEQEGPQTGNPLIVMRDPGFSWVLVPTPNDLLFLRCPLPLV